MSLTSTTCVSAVVLLLAAVAVVGAPSVSAAADAGADASGDPVMPWWGWSLVVFVFCFGLGILAVVAGVGGGVLYVPLVAGFFPFHMDYVRTAGLMVALSGALAAGPGLIRRGLANMRVALPCALFASGGMVLGALVGLSMPEQVVQLLLGVAIMGIAVLMTLARNAELPRVEQPDRLGRWLGMAGVYSDGDIDGHTWGVHRTPLGLLLLIGVGFLGGMFGLGAGWANVPVLNLVLGVPLKAAVGSSVFMISVTGTSGAWVYLNSGGWMPVLAVPSIVGLMLGTQIGVRILGRTRPRSVRYVVIVVLVLAGVRSILKGLGV